MRNSPAWAPSRRSAGTSLAEPAGMRSMLLLAALAGCHDSSFHISNRSDYAIEELYVTQIENPSWGPNLLDEPIEAGDTLVLDICCGTYDTLVVDETGSLCEVPYVDICFEDADWVIRNTRCSVDAVGVK